MKVLVIAAAAAILGPAGEPRAQSPVLEWSGPGQTLLGLKSRAEVERRIGELLAEPAQEADDWSRVSAILGHPGKKNADGSFKVTLPRTEPEIKGRLGYVVPPQMGLGSFAAFAGELDDAIVVGDTCMLEHEINPVIDALRAGDIEVVALHNHMLADDPRLFFMHFQGTGDALALARTIRKAWDRLGTTPPEEHTLPAGAEAVAPDWDELARIFGTSAKNAGAGIRKFTRARTDLKVELDGRRFPAGIGLTSWAAFYACPCGRTVVKGDTVVTREELQAAIDALRAGGVRVSAIHNHFLGERTQIAFLHIEAEGDAAEIARAVRRAWDSGRR